jgi:putative PIN family toxin of toxin-antitoxin system
VRVFLDTNVLVSAFATRGLCADVFRHIVAEHSLVTGEVVLKELRRVLRTRIRLPIRTIDAIEDFLREQEVVPRPDKAANIALRDPDDKWILASALAAKVDVLVTGDRDLLDLGPDAPIRILDPRGFWTLIREG